MDITLRETQILRWACLDLIENIMKDKVHLFEIKEVEIIKDKLEKLEETKIK